MTILISSKTLAGRIEQALVNNALIFTISGETNSFTFENKQGLISDIAIESRYRNTYYGVFKEDQWKNILEFINGLPEQPLVMEVSDYRYSIHTDPEITFRDVTKHF